VAFHLIQPLALEGTNQTIPVFDFFVNSFMTGIDPLSHCVLLDTSSIPALWPSIPYPLQPARLHPIHASGHFKRFQHQANCQERRVCGQIGEKPLDAKHRRK
jgi:hypothetical protein